MDRPAFDRRLHQYADRHQLVIERQLGFGVHGTVFSARHQTKGGQSAVKVYERENDYARERDVYFRLHDHSISSIRGCDVPNRSMPTTIFG